MGPVTTSPRRSQDLARAVRGSPVRTWRREGKLSRRQKPYTTGQRACRPAGRNSGTRGKIRIQAKTDKSSDISHVVSTKYVGWLPERCDRRHKIWASVSFALHRPRVAPPRSHPRRWAASLTAEPPPLSPDQDGSRARRAARRAAWGERSVGSSPASSSVSAAPSGFGTMRAGLSSATQTRCVPGRRQ